LPGDLPISLLRRNRQPLLVQTRKPGSRAGLFCILILSSANRLFGVVRVVMMRMVMPVMMVCLGEGGHRGRDYGQQNERQQQLLHARIIAAVSAGAIR